MKLTLTKGFTLIELLVVITIIWVLATGAVTVYTSQIQKARDTTRLNDVKAIQGAVEQSYQDSFSYPDSNALATALSTYMQAFPRDGKHTQTCAKVSSASAVYCGYVYRTGNDANGITNGSYEISTAFENSANITAKASQTADNGDDTDRLELGLLMSGASGSIDTSTDLSTAPTALAWICDITATTGVAPAAGVAVFIAGRSTAPGGCG